jgi:hypothetical protein
MSDAAVMYVAGLILSSIYTCDIDVVEMALEELCSKRRVPVDLRFLPFTSHVVRTVTRGPGDTSSTKQRFSCYGPWRCSHAGLLSSTNSKARCRAEKRITADTNDTF